MRWKYERKYEAFGIYCSHKTAVVCHISDRRNRYPQLVYPGRAIGSRASIFTHVLVEWLRELAGPLTFLSKILSFSQAVFAYLASSWTSLAWGRKRIAGRNRGEREKKSGKEKRERGQCERARLIAGQVTWRQYLSISILIVPFPRFRGSDERAALSGCRITWRVSARAAWRFSFHESGFPSCEEREIQKSVSHI